MLFLEAITPPGQTVELPGASFPLRSDFERRQNFGESESGRLRVFDRGPEVQTLALRIPGVDPEKQSQIETFIRLVARYRLNPFFFRDDSQGGEKIRVRYFSGTYARNQVNFRLFDVEILLRVEL